MAQSQTDHETEASRHRREIAAALAAGCPPGLGSEIILTGSAARGIADDDSDIEMVCLADDPPAHDTYLDWLREAGATHLACTGTDIETTWATCRYGDVWAEVGWSSIPAFDTLLERIAGGEFQGHARLMRAGAIARAVPLRTHGLLARWQTLLRRYPDSLRAAIIADNTEAWSDRHVPPVRWALVRRNQRMGLAMRLTWDMQNLLNVLWAVNRRWPEDWKWTDARSLDLEVAPARLSERINRVFTFDDPAEAVRTAFELIEETLLLVPAEFDVSAALASIRAASSTGEPIH